MSKKLLNESTIRRFMKLASIDTFSNSFLNETGMPAYARDEELDEPVEDLGEPDLGEPDLGEEPEDLGGLDAEEPATAATVGDVVDAIVSAVQETVPELEINVEGGEEEMPSPEEELGDEEFGGEEFGGEELGGEELGGEEELALQETNFIDEAAIKESVYRKVLSHLVNRR